MLLLLNMLCNVTNNSSLHNNIWDYTNVFISLCSLSTTYCPFEAFGCLTLSLSALYQHLKSMTSHHQHLWSFWQNFNGSQNVQYVKRVCAFKQTHFILASCVPLLSTLKKKKKTVWTKRLEDHVSVKDYVWIGDRDRYGVDHFHQQPLSLHSPVRILGSTFNLGNIRQFRFVCCLMFNDHVILHMHLLAYVIACFCFFVCCDQEILYSFRRCVILPPTI